jgi:hypothetical protein
MQEQAPRLAVGRGAWACCYCTRVTRTRAVWAARSLAVSESPGEGWDEK